MSADYINEYCAYFQKLLADVRTPADFEAICVYSNTKVWKRDA